jgi:hypothetical protein
MPEEGLLCRLEVDGIVRFEPDGRPRTTRKWQAAMARAAFHLYGAGDEGADLRVPIAHAVVELYGESRTDEDLAEIVEAMLPIEAAELDPRAHLREVGTPPVTARP